VQAVQLSKNPVQLLGGGQTAGFQVPTREQVLAAELGLHAPPTPVS